MKTIQASSGYQPQALDKTSSPTTVYVRENVIETFLNDEIGGCIPWWEYTERQYDKQEWEQAQIAKYVINLEYQLVLLETCGGII